MENSTPTRLYANVSPETPILKRGGGIAGIILWYEIISLLHSPPTVPYISTLLNTV